MATCQDCAILHHPVNLWPLYRKQYVPFDLLNWKKDLRSLAEEVIEKCRKTVSESPDSTHSTSHFYFQDPVMEIYDVETNAAELVCRIEDTANLKQLIDVAGSEKKFRIATPPKPPHWPRWSNTILTLVITSH